MLRVKVKKVHSKAVLPIYAHKGDAAMDLFASETVILRPDIQQAVPTGIQMEIPKGYVGLIWDKSGLSIKNGLKTLGGVIDSGYRGEILIGMINLLKENYILEQGHKVAQMIIQKKENVVLEEVDELGDSERGQKGFGSTGK